MTDTNTPSAPGTAPSTGKAPVFEGEFDADRATRLVENLRADLAKANEKFATATAALQAREDAEKTELQKAMDRIALLEKENGAVKTEAARTRIAAKHNLPDDVLEFLTGDTEEEIEKRATALAKFAAKTDEGETPPEIPGKPKPRLVPGHTTDDANSGAFDAQAVANAIRAQQ